MSNDVLAKQEAAVMAGFTLVADVHKLLFAYLRAEGEHSKPKVVRDLFKRFDQTVRWWARSLSAYASREVSHDEAAQMFADLVAHGRCQMQCASGRVWRMTTQQGPVVLTPEQDRDLWLKVRDIMCRDPRRMAAWREEHGDWRPWEERT